MRADAGAGEWDGWGGEDGIASMSMTCCGTMGMSGAARSDRR